MKRAHWLLPGNKVKMEEVHQEIFVCIVGGLGVSHQSKHLDIKIPNYYSITLIFNVFQMIFRDKSSS